jgi:hypothetical protein
MLTKKIKSMLFGFLIAGIGWLVIVIFGQVSTLQCAHTETSQVACIKQVTLLGLMPIREEMVRDVRGAWVAESCDDDGCTYRVVLNTGEGDVPLTVYYSSGWRSKQETVTQINEYISRRGDEPLEIREGIGIVAALLGGILMIVGAGIAIVRGRQ